MSIIQSKLDKKQISDSGLALTFACLLLGFILKEPLFFKVATAALLISMLIPIILYPFAVFWYTLALLLSKLSSSILLSAVFFVIVVPMGMVRKILGKDNLKLRKFKQSSGSVFIVRDHVYQPEDIEKPF